jgi:hypothetical protein
MASRYPVIDIASEIPFANYWQTRVRSREPSEASTESLMSNAGWFDWFRGRWWRGN